MVWGVRWYLVGSVMLGVLGVLAGCSGGFFGAEREAWRHEAEVQCLASGAVKESAGVVRIQSINGPGMCGADFPLKVAVLGEGGSLGYSDEVRPPGMIPNASQQPRWPVAPPTDARGQGNGPISLNPPECGEFDRSAARASTTIASPMVPRRHGDQATCASRRPEATTSRRYRMSAGG